MQKLNPILLSTAGALVALFLLLGACSRRPAGESSPPVLTGQFAYFADAASFTACADGRRYPVAMEGAYLELERAYLDVVNRPGLPLLVEIEGAVEDRPAMEGDRTVPTLVISRVRGCFPGETCGNPQATSNLTETYWKLTRLGGRPVARFAGRREPHLVFRGEQHRVTGSTGCNTLQGAFGLVGEQLTLGRLAVTLAACPEGADQERRFLAALEQVRAWRITGTHLELLDESGEVLARFEDTPLH